MSSGIFDKTTEALASSLSLRQVRQNVISSNIANAETPGYKAKKVDFENALAKALDKEDVKSVAEELNPELKAFNGLTKNLVKADIYEDPDAVVGNDGNSVDMEKEMSALSENAILYKAALQLINKKMAALKYAASETR